MLISGEIDEIRFRNDENGYTIIVIDCDGEPVVAVGNFPPLSEGETVRLSGEYILHQKFGRQFKAVSIEKRAPATLVSIARYLGSGIIKGIGPKTALAIVERFGIASLNVIEYQPGELAKIRGITKARAQEISKTYRDNKAMQDAVMFLQNQNITLNMAIKIYKVYGSNTIAVVSANPYRLIEDIDGIGFATADKIASVMGIAPDSDFRMRAALLHVLKEAGERNGDTYLPEEDLAAEAAAKTGTEAPDSAARNIRDLIIDQKLKVIELGELKGVALKSTYHTEKSAAAKLMKLHLERDRLTHDCSGDVGEFEKQNDIIFHHTQKLAIDCAVNSGISVITGGPGTGKTTIIKCIISLMKKLKRRFMMMAPTGRAAKRLSESTGESASTIHRALMACYDSGGESSIKGSNLPADTVIIDEFSMVDIFLLHNLLSRLNHGTKLIIVGDKDQLPSVGAGNCLKDIIESGIFPVIALTEIYRQSENSLIAVNAHEINEGRMPELSKNDKDFFFIRTKEQLYTADKIVELAAERIPKYLDVDPYRVQVLCPMKNGYTGSIYINKSLQETMNPYKDKAGLAVSSAVYNTKIEVKTEKEIFRVGDKVMHTANNYQLEWIRNEGYSSEKGSGVFNGDLGRISDIDAETGSLEVLFEDGRKAQYPPDIREQLSLAYAITVHKSQGSEFDAVIMPVAGGNPVIMTRNLLYTAITRAKKLVVLVGEEYYIKKMIDNNYIARRFSALGHFMLESQKDLDMLYES